jgi:hypothetical protein
MIFNKVAVNPPELKDRYADSENAILLDITVVNKDGRRYPAHPGIALSAQGSRFITDTIVSQSLVLRFNKVLDKTSSKMELGIKESGGITDLITLKVYEFPMINVLLVGRSDHGDRVCNVDRTACEKQQPWCFTRFLTVFRVTFSAHTALIGTEVSIFKY